MHRRVHARDQCTKLRDLFRFGALGDATPDHVVEARAHIVDLIGFVHRDLAHEDAAILLDADEAGFFECAKRFAHRPATDAQLRGDVGFVQLAARRHITRQDHSLELAMRERCQRVRAQHGERRRVIRLRRRGHHWHGCCDRALAGWHVASIRREV